MQLLSSQHRRVKSNSPHPYQMTSSNLYLRFNFILGFVRTSCAIVPANQYLWEEMPVSQLFKSVYILHNYRPYPLHGISFRLTALSLLYLIDQPPNLSRILLILPGNEVSILLFNPILTL